MEDLPAWPASVFEDQTTLEMRRTGLAVTKNKEFTATVKKWRDKREAILHDIDNATEIVQMELVSAKEFLDCQTLRRFKSKYTQNSMRRTLKGYV